MNDLAEWSMITGILAPLVISVIQQPKFNRALRAVITVLVCLVIAVVTVALQGELTLTRWSHSVVLILVAAWAAYGHFWQPTGIGPKVEAATSPGQTVPTPSAPVANPNPMPGASNPR